MLKTYDIRFDFRGRWISALVHDHGAHLLVYTSDTDILKDFTGRFEFTLPDKKFVPGHQNNKDAKDLMDLVRAMQKQLH